MKKLYSEPGCGRYCEGPIAEASNPFMRKDSMKESMNLYF